MKTLLTTLTLLFALFNCYSQGYNNSYLVGRPACVFRGLGLDGDTLIAHGYIADSVNPYPVTYVMAKFLEDGTPLYLYSSRPDSIPEVFTQNHFLRTADGDYIFVGSSNPTVNSYFLRLNKNGNLDSWRKYTYNGQTTYQFIGIEQLVDSSYVILAVQGDGNQYHGTTILKVDNYGNIIWNKVLSYTYSPVGISVTAGTIINVSATWYTSVGANSRYNAVDFKVDTSGATLSVNVDTTNQSFGWDKRLDVDGDRHIIIANHLSAMYYDGSNGYIALRNVAITMRDTQQHIIWQNVIGQASAIPHLYQAKMLSDGNYLAVGGTYDSTYTDVQPYKSTGWLIKFNQQGNIMWQRKYFNTTDMPGQTNYLYDFVELPNGDIVAAGERIDWFVDYPQRGWLLRVDANGCMYNSCGVWAEVPEIAKPEIKVYPNPVAGNLFIGLTGADVNDALNITLTNVQGSTVYQGRLATGTDTYTINTTHIPNGVYFIGLFSANQLIGRSKVIVQH
jgi:hypothetical protein